MVHARELENLSPALHCEIIAALGKFVWSKLMNLDL